MSEESSEGHATCHPSCLLSSDGEKGCVEKRCIFLQKETVFCVNLSGRQLVKTLVAGFIANIYSASSVMLRVVP